MSTLVRSMRRWETAHNIATAQFREALGSLGRSHWLSSSNESLGGVAFLNHAAITTARAKLLRQRFACVERARELVDDEMASIVSSLDSAMSALGEGKETPFPSKTLTSAPAVRGALRAARDAFAREVLLCRSLLDVFRELCTSAEDDRHRLLIAWVERPFSAVDGTPLGPTPGKCSSCSNCSCCRWVTSQRAVFVPRRCRM